MKTIKFLCFLSAMSIAAFSCSKMEEGKQSNDNNLVCDTFTLGAPDTRTSLGSDDKVSWNAGDTIVYYSNLGNAEAGYQKRYTTISKVGESAQVTLYRNEGENFYVLCSAGIASSVMGLNDRTLTSFTPNNVLCPEQTGEFAKANVCVGYVDLTKKPVSDDLTMQNVTSLVEFSVDADRNIKKLEFFGNNNEAVAGGTNGRAKVDVTTQEHFVAVPKDNSNISTKITISKEAPMSGKYYFSVFPGTFSKGFTIRYWPNNYKYFYSEVGTSSSKTFTAGKLIGVGSPFTSTVATADMTATNLFEANNVTPDPTGQTSPYKQEMLIDGVVTLSAPGTNQGACYLSDWRLYQARGTEFTISTSKGTIKSVTISYNNKNTGTLKDGNTVIASGTTVNIGAASKTFTIGNTGSLTNGQVRITNIKVILEN